jgi:hypothetical protein
MTSPSDSLIRLSTGGLLTENGRLQLKNKVFFNSIVKLSKNTLLKRYFLGKIASFEPIYVLANQSSREKGKVK